MKDGPTIEERMARIENAVLAAGIEVPGLEPPEKPAKKKKDD